MLLEIKKRPGTYIRTPEIRAKQSKPKTEELKRKLRVIFLAKFANGYTNPMKGRKHTEEAKRKMNRVGMIHSDESRRKMSIARKGKRVGKENNFWKGGITNLSSQIRNSNEYIYWRKLVFERDNYTCQHCKIRGRNELNADHIKPFSFLIKKNNIKILQEAIQCKEFWDLENGRTLCRQCHIATPTFALNAKYYVNS